MHYELVLKWWLGRRLPVKCDHDRGKKAEPHLRERLSQVRTHVRGKARISRRRGVRHGRGAEPAQPKCRKGSWNAVWTAEGKAVPAVQFGYEDPGPDAGAHALLLSRCVGGLPA